MLLIKFIAAVLAAFAISKSYLDYRKKREPFVMFVFWSLVWLGAGVIIIYPALIDKVIAFTQDKTINVSSLIGLAFIFLLFIVYRIYAKVARVEYQFTELVRKTGIKKANEDKRDS